MGEVVYDLIKSAGVYEYEELPLCAATAIRTIP